jgi:hypothetical protein
MNVYPGGYHYLMGSDSTATHLAWLFLKRKCNTEEQRPPTGFLKIEGVKTGEINLLIQKPV